MENIVRKWLERAKYDLVTAAAMLNSHRYLYVAFMCQQSLEKLLKAIMIEQGKEVLRTHNLVRLSELTDVHKSMSQEEQNFLADLAPFAVEARYGDYRDKLSEIVNRKSASNYLVKTSAL
ncbi:MAG: HEPN domain-containing protein [Candidatus Omnitrophota bacterium]|nr:HEPN domain-containing protein [Candidatus Omnitrophota bacterium]